MRTIICAYLRGMNLEADVAENGEAACTLAEESITAGNPYALILMDMGMPRINGYDAVRRLRKAGWEGPIVALTASATKEDRQKCLDAGCTDHVSKPFAKLAFREVVTRHMAGTVVK